MNAILAAVCCFALGDYAALTSQLSIYLAIIVLLGGVLGALTSHYFVQREKAFTLSCLIIILSAGFFSGWQAKTARQKVLKILYKQERTLWGEIVPGTVKLRKHGYLTFTMFWQETSYKIKVILSKWPNNRKVPFYGKVIFKGVVEPANGFANPGLPSQEQKSMATNTLGEVRATAQHSRIGPGRKDAWYYGAILSKRLQKLLTRNMSAQDSALLAGMVLGEKNSIAQDVLKEFSATGIIHLLAVSGTHVALLMGFVLFLLGSLGIKAKGSLLPVGLFLVGYVIICGPRPSILRATFMGLALLAGKAFERQEDTTAVWSGTLLFLLAIRPCWILDIGFQLSFLATGGLLWFYEPIKSLLEKVLPTALSGLLAVSLAAQLPMVPLLVHHFHQLSLISPLANLIVVPLLSLVLTATMSGLLISLGLPLIGKLFLLPATQVLGGALTIIKFLGGLSYGNCSVGSTPNILWLFYYVFLAAVFNFWPLDGFALKRRQYLACCCAGLFVLGAGWNYFAPRPFTVYFLDVGQGDCALVLTPDGHSIMVDTGGLSGDFDTGEKIVLPVLRYLGVRKLDVLILSHGHHDHAGGAATIAKNIPIGKILVPEGKDSRDLEQLWHVLKSQKIVYKIQTNAIFALKKCIICIIKAPDYREELCEGNESSAVVKICQDGKSILFTGDATEEIEMSTLDKQIASNVLKLSHHGSRTSSAREFLQKVNPQLTIISAGRKNRFGHPHKEVLARLSALGLPYVRTDLEGAIKVVFDGEKSLCYSYNKQPNYF